MAKSTGKIKKWFIKKALVPFIFAILILFVSAQAYQTVNELIVALLSIQREGNFTEYDKYKLQVAPEIAEYKEEFKEAIRIAIKQYNRVNTYKIQRLEYDDKSLNYWMIGVCAAATENWTKNTEHNIMGVRGLPEDCTPSESIQAAAKLIIDLYGELTCKPIEDTMIDTEWFMKKYYLSQEQYYDPEWNPVIQYEFGSDFQFGYPNLTGKTYLDMNPEGEQKDIETDRIASQKMMMFTACYFYGKVDIRQFWQFIYTGPDYEYSGEWVEDNGIRHVFWDDQILSQYNSANVTRQRKDIEEARKRALNGDVNDKAEYEEMDKTVFSLDLSLVNMVYKYYDVYNVQVNIGGNFASPLGFDGDNDVLLSSIIDCPDGKFGYREITSDTGGNVSSGDEDSPHKGYDLQVYKVPVYACCDGYVSDIDETRYGTGGVFITITSADGAYSFDYMHLMEGSLKVSAGEKVKKGQQIAISGNTSQGESTFGYHLHFTILDNSDGKYIDPLFIFSGGEQTCLTNEDIAIMNKRRSRGEYVAIKAISEVPAWFVSSNYSNEDVRILSSMIACECVGTPFDGGGQPYAGKLGCGIVAQNRLELWKDQYGFETIKDVLMQTLGDTYMFSPAAPGGSLTSALEVYDEGRLDDECISAAIEALSGTKAVPYNGTTYDFTGFLFYANVGKKDRPGVVVIGDHGYAKYQYWRD